MICNGTASRVVNVLFEDGDFLCEDCKLYRIGIRPVDAEGIDMLELEHFPISSQEKGTGTMVVPVDQIVAMILAGDAVALPASIGMKRARVVSLLQPRSSRNPGGPDGLPEPRPERLLDFIEQGIIFTGDMLPVASSAIPANG